MQNFEKLGAFYLGRRDSPDPDQPGEEPVLYDARDLTTHAMIIGMTGSGKTGLGISLIEEAALDHIPVIAIDPKGDMGNLLLTFPELRGSDFEPWVDKAAASEAGMDVADYAAQTAANWRQGLADWGQQPERIAALRNAADATIYTPGSSAGKPLSVLRAFSAPDADTLADEDRYRERLQVTVTGILTLLGIDADPLQSREHILLSNILDSAWRDGVSPDLEALITAIQTPAFDKIGVMALDTFYPAKDRFALAMQMNSLLAAPGFQAWLAGDALDINRLLYNDSGKPRIAVVSIAHLDDRQRMFFVTMLLNQLVSWMRAQSGSASLRAILYMDEVFGYMPPVANPPSKQLLLTLLKQARAYGLGVVLATQNPVDLDYRGLSNIGTWFIGRLQTERDKARVRDGLQSAAASASLDGPALDRTLASLKKRRFLLHNVHEEFPVILQTRWVMSFLAGPLTRDQISRLTDSATASEPDSEAAADKALLAVEVPEQSLALASPPPVPPEIDQVFAENSSVDTPLYTPRLLAKGSVNYHNARMNVNMDQPFVLVLKPGADDDDASWADSVAVDTGLGLSRRAPLGARYQECPAELLDTRRMQRCRRDLLRWIRTDRPLILLKSPKLKLTSMPGESERDFRIRLQQAANDARDAAVLQMRNRFEKRFATQRDRIVRARQAVEREAEQSSQQTIDAAISFGTAVLGALLGRKKLSATTAGRMGTAARKAGRVGGQAGDVRRAEELLAAAQVRLDELEVQLQDEIDKLDSVFDAQLEVLEEVVVRARSNDIRIEIFGIGWMPAGNGPMAERLPRGVV